MPSREGSYELTSDFRNTKRDLDQKLHDDLQRDLDSINRDLPSGHSQRAVRIEDACCGHLDRTAKKYWQELLEPAPLSNQRRSELFQRAINEAFQEIGACARKCGGYEAVENFRDNLLRGDLADGARSTASASDGQSKPIAGADDTSTPKKADLLSEDMPTIADIGAALNANDRKKAVQLRCRLDGCKVNELWKSAFQSRRGKDSTKQTAFDRWLASRRDTPSWAAPLMRTRLLQ
jgi:hypothetical protein